MAAEYEKTKQAELHEKFDDLQKKLIPLWEQIGRTDPGIKEIEEENTVVVLPSLAADVKMDFSIRQAYEERMLFMLFLLRQPHIRIIYLTSVSIPNEIIDYYLDILPSVTISNARKRLVLISPQDSSDRVLVLKILERPELIEKIRSCIPDLNKAHLVPFLTTDPERDLAVQLGIPMYAADPRFFGFGTKSGCRQIFTEEGVQHPIGAENIHTKDDLIKAVCKLRSEKPDIKKVIVKHNDGVSGFGNATLNLTGLPKPSDKNEKSALEKRLKEMKFELESVTYEWYMEELNRKGGIVEEMITGKDIHSPSAQLRVTPLGEVELLSTHDQMLGGPTGQIYMGSRFPANEDYGPMIMREAEKVGKRFAREGIVGRFALDFMVVRGDDGQWKSYALEINLRKGATTHPFLTLQYLTGGYYCMDSGQYMTAQDRVKCYLATDSLHSDAYKKFIPADLFDIVSNNRLHFDHTSHTGIVFSIISAVATHGKLGITAIGDSHQHAEELYQRFIDVLNKAAE